MTVLDELVLHEDERGEHARADDGGGHGVARKVRHLPLRLAGQEEILDGDTLKGQGLDADEGTAAVGHEGNHGRGEAGADTRRAGSGGSIHVLGQVPHQRLVHRVGIRLGQTKKVDVHEIEDAVRLCLTPVVPGVVGHGAATLPVGEGSALAESLLGAGTLVAGLAPRPLRGDASVVLPGHGEHLSALVNPWVVGVEEERLEGGGRGSAQGSYLLLPVLHNLRARLVLARVGVGDGNLLALLRVLGPGGEEVDARARVGDVVVLGVQAHEVALVTLPLEFLGDLLPGRVAHVLKDDDRGQVLRHPGHHTPESLSRLTLLIESLLLVVEVGVIDAGRARDEHVHVTGHVHQSTVCGGGLISVELADVAEEDGRGKVALDVSLLEGLNLAREDVVDAELLAVLNLGGVADLVEREEGRLGAGAHGGHADGPSESLDQPLQLGELLDHVREHALDVADRGELLGEANFGLRLGRGAPAAQREGTGHLGSVKFWAR